MADKLLTFVHLSDTHIHIDPEYTSDHVNFAGREPVQKLIDAVNSLPMEVDFVMHTGDVAHFPETPEHYHVARNILNQIRFPTYYCPGNHDIVADFQGHFLGMPSTAIMPTYDITFDVNDVQIVMLDTHVPPSSDGHSGYITPEQLDWLDGICRAKDDRPLVVGMHHHPVPLHAPWLDRIVLRNGVALHNTLLHAKHRLRGVFFGHIHEQITIIRDGISYYSVYSGWYQTQTWHNQAEPTQSAMHAPGFNLVTITETDTFVRSIRVPVTGSGAIAISKDDEI